MAGDFFITIDTEGDNNWRAMYSCNSVKNRFSTRNGDFIPRFQELCEKYGFKPTYLVNYEMTFSDIFVNMAKVKEKQGKCEIGMHMHAWSAPPYHFLKRGLGHVGGCNPYITEYPYSVIEEKVQWLTSRLQDVFECDMVSHRSGRWMVNEKYLAILKKHNYLVDCSVTPGINWKSNLGLTKYSRGQDYRRFPDNIYEICLGNISTPGRSGMLEIPVTIFRGEWLRPNGRNLTALENIICKKIENKVGYLEFMLHSSELMPFGSPNFLTENSIEKLYQDIDAIFKLISEYYKGVTLKEYAHRYFGKGSFV